MKFFKKGVPTSMAKKPLTTRQPASISSSSEYCLSGGGELAQVAASQVRGTLYHGYQRDVRW